VSLDPSRGRAKESTMICVLIVDGDAAALDALRGQLPSAPEEWQLHFAATASEALRFMEEDTPDVVVIDLAQLVNAVKLLQEVETRHPKAVRIVTSAKPEHRSYVESIGVAHQFLQKPVAGEALTDAIVRACSLRRWAVKPDVVSAVRRFGRPPRLPQVYRALTQAIQREASLSEIGGIVGTDAVMAGRLLQVANSALFAPRHPISSTEHAASFIGLEKVRSIVIFEGLAGSGSGGTAVQARVQEIWRHSLEIAAIARLIAGQEKASQEELSSAFSLGILHDLGAILLARHHDPIDAGDENQSAEEKERERHGLAHTDAGAYLALEWGLPDDVVEVIASHHDPLRFGTSNRPSPGFFVAAACTFGDASADRIDSRAIERLSAVLAARGLSDRLDTWREVAEMARQAEAAKPLA
jgi:HD-like signal output (HDOD) protein